MAEIDCVNYYLFLFGVVEPQLLSSSPCCTGCCCPGAKVLHDLLVVLVGDLTHFALDVGLYFKLVVSIRVGGVEGVGCLGGVVSVVALFDPADVAVGEKALY